MDPIIIIAPDGTEVEFPPGTTDAQIEAAMKAEYGGAESADLYPQPGDVEYIDQGMVAANTDPNAMALQGYRFDPERQSYVKDTQVEAPRPVGVVEDVARVTPSGLAQGVTAIAGMPGSIQQATIDRIQSLDAVPQRYRDALSRMVRYADPQGGAALVGDVFDGIMGRDTPIRSRYASTQELDTLVQGAMGQYYEPQTTAGEVWRTIAQNAPGALVPGGLATRSASVLVPALMSEAAGQVARGYDEQANRRDLSDLVTGESPQRSNVEPWARLAAGLIGGGAVAGGAAARGGVGRVVQNATEGVTPQQLQLAEALQGRAASVGVPLTNAEALQQVTGGATGLSRVQRVVEGANTRLAPMMAERPTRTASAIARTLDQIAPETQGSQVAMRAQSGADKVLNTLRQRVNESASPIYDRLPGQTLGPDEYAQLASNPSYAAAQGEVTGNPELAALLSAAPEDLSTVNRVVTQLDQMAENARPGVMNPMGNNTIAAQRSQAAALARQLSEDASPDFRLARETVRTGNEAFVEPVRAGPIGRIANQNEAMPGLQGQTNALFPSAPFEGQAQETAQALRLLNEVDPSVPPSLVRQHLAQQAAEATQGLQSGENAFGGANFVARAMGNPAQRETLLGAVDVAAPQASRDVRDLAEVLAATGRREGSGSQTAFSGSLQQDMRGGNLMQGLMQTVTDPLGTPKRLSTSVDDMFARRNAEALAEILAGDSRAFSELVMRSARQPRGTGRLRLLAAALGSQQEDNQ